MNRKAFLRALTALLAAPAALVSWVRREPDPLEFEWPEPTELTWEDGAILPDRVVIAPGERSMEEMRELTSARYTPLSDTDR